MKSILLFLFSFYSSIVCFGQTEPVSNTGRVLIIPYQPMMYFSDADVDIARSSKLNEQQTRQAMRNNFDVNMYHQLLGSFDAISLMRATSMDSEGDLTRVYKSTRYTLYSKEMKEARDKETAVVGNTGEAVLHTGRQKIRVKEKDPSFHISDSAVMLAMIGDPELIRYLTQKYNQQYILFITQMEVNTSNKNTIEWMKQKYERTYTVHYNVFNKSGNLLWAEMLTVKGGNENNVKEINDKYLIRLAGKIKDLMIAEFK